MMDFVFGIISLIGFGRGMKAEVKTLVQTFPTDRRKK